MSNKKIIKDVFDKHLNIDIMHDNLIRKIEKKKRIMNTRYILVPVTILLLGFFFSFLFYNRQVKYQEKESQKRNNVIHINIMNDDSKRYIELLDIDGRMVNKDKKEMVQMFPFVSNIKVPIQNPDTKLAEVYASSNPKSEFYHKLIGYNLTYLEDNYEEQENGKSVSIFFSEIYKERGRCFPIIKDNLENSFLYDTPVKIIKFYDRYVAFFQKQDLYFDLETKNITEKELIELITSILKEEGYEN